MKLWKLIFRSLFFYRRTYLGVLAGVALGTAVLTGALLVGESVRHSLTQMVFARLGDTRFAMATGDRFFSWDLAERLAGNLGVKTVPVIQARGMAISGGGADRINGIEINGVDSTFWSLWPGCQNDFPGSREAVVNESLASRLGLKPGDTFLIRAERMDVMPQDMPLVPVSDNTAAFRVSVRHVASDRSYGRFSLRANQVAPYNVFVRAEVLTDALELDRKANIVLVGGGPDLEPGRLQDNLASLWRLEDAGLKIVSLKNGKELQSNRIFIESAVSRAAEQAYPGQQGVLTYFVNEIRCGIRATPYSFVAGLESPFPLQDNEILIHSWLARDLEAGVGDEITLSYYIAGPSRRLEESEETFLIRGILPMTGQMLDPSLMPWIPGLSDARHCGEWDPGLPIDLKKIRKKDEDYWDLYRGTPKAFITLDAARRLWQNRFGDLTAIRFQGENEAPEQALLRNLDPVSLGFVFMPVREQGIEAGVNGVDFGQLFLGLSFFLVAAAVLFAGLLFVFGVENRSGEIGTLLSVGLTTRRIRTLFLAEGTAVALVGGLTGPWFGVLYQWFALKGLGTVWKGAVGSALLEPHVTLLPLALGAVSGILAGTIAVWIACVRLFRKSPNELQKAVSSSRFPWISLAIAVASISGSAVLVCLGFRGQGREAVGTFFGAGTLLLAGFLALLHAAFQLFTMRRGSGRMSLAGVGFRNAMRKRGRSLSVAGLLACGIFVIIGVGANRQDLPGDADDRRSGTGGFAFYGQTAVPVYDDLNDPVIKTRLGVPESVSFVPMKVQEGDDASCLNLNRISSPQILGFNPLAFARRQAFSFVSVWEGLKGEDPWTVLNRSFGDVIPGIADQTVIVWGLEKSIGDTLFYTDEKGRPFRVKLVGGLANSVFQGNVLIAERHFLEHFPSTGGFRIFLVDAPPGDRAGVSERLRFHYEDSGLDLSPCGIRLAGFYEVENTYLSIFLALGGLGLILGSAGVGIVVMRNVMERRQELALLRAVGFDKGLLQKLILSEHIGLLCAGLGIGTLASVIAVLPAILVPGIRLPVLSILVALSAVFLSGILWIVIATSLSMRKDLLSALRRE